MDFQSLVRYAGQQVKLTLNNGFWYRAKIISVEEHAVIFVEQKGRTVTVEPSAVELIEEVN